MENRARGIRGCVALVLSAGIFGAAAAWAEAPAMSFGYQPMVSTGLAARHPFEAWLWLDRSSDPTVPGYALPAGATIRVHFPAQFTPEPGHPLGAVMLHGWSQGPIPARFTVTPDPADPRTIVIHFDEGIVSGPVERPGLKAIHLRTAELNPAAAGDYPISVEFLDAGPLTGTRVATARITPTPVPNVASYNHLHDGRDADWQRVHPGVDAPLPIDFLVTLPDEARAALSLRPAGDGTLDILRDGKRIGSIRTTGVPVTLTPQAFGPGFARLGIIRVHVKAGTTRGMAEIVASLEGGTQTTIHFLIE